MTALAFDWGVYFEKKGARSALVKEENLRIAFELPNDNKKPNCYVPHMNKLDGISIMKSYHQSEPLAKGLK